MLLFLFLSILSFSSSSLSLNQEGLYLQQTKLSLRPRPSSLRNGTPGTEPGRSGRNSARKSGSGRDFDRDKNVAVLSRNLQRDGAFRPFRPERDGINNFGWDYFQVGDKIVKDMDRLEALKIALTTWATWIDHNTDPSKTKVYFQGVAAVHLDPKEWKDPDPSARTCVGQTKPVEGPKYPGPSHPGEAVVRSVISKMARPAYLLDITLLTQLRKDGHPGRYATKSLALNDCSHWCLAGVPDTWNQLLYAALLQN